MEQINNKVLRLFEECHKLSNTTVADVFFNYIPHCDTISLLIYPDGWKRGNKYILRNVIFSNKNFKEKSKEEILKDLDTLILEIKTIEEDLK
ncbi:MAG: hypothetical protein RR662_03955 [Clostridia bacterium]